MQVARVDKCPLKRPLQSTQPFRLDNEKTKENGTKMQISKSAPAEMPHQAAARHFHLALEQNNPSLLLDIVKNHHVDSMDKDGLTLLHRSVLAERIEFVQQLISLGANVTLASRDGWSPLHLAAFKGNTEILVFLLKSSSGSSENS